MYLPEILCLFFFFASAYIMKTVIKYDVSKYKHTCFGIFCRAELLHLIIEVNRVYEVNKFCQPEKSGKSQCFFFLLKRNMA